jgi:hypothetical protein
VSSARSSCASSCGYDVSCAGDADTDTASNARRSCESSSLDASESGDRTHVRYCSENEARTSKVKLGIFVYVQERVCMQVTVYIGKMKAVLKRHAN